MICLLYVRHLRFYLCACCNNNFTFHVLKNMLSNLRVICRPDELLWGWNASCRFPVKSTYTALIASKVFRDYLLTKIWSFRISTKVQIFSCLALKSWVLMANNLLKKGRARDAICVACGDDLETVDHIFIRCIVSSKYLLMMHDTCRGKNKMIFR